MGNSKLEGVYKGKHGYGALKLKRLEEVKIPEKLPCEVCKKPKTVSVSFSKKQIMNFKNGVATGRITQKNMQQPMWVTCTNCTPKQKTEMLCIQCKTWKDLDGFTKAQRRTPDAAICVPCVHENTNYVPMLSAADEFKHLQEMENQDSSEDDDDTDSNPYTDPEDGNSMSGVPIMSGPSTAKLNDENLRDLPSNPPSGINSWQTYANSAATNPASHNARATYANAAASGNGKQRAFTGYDNQGNAHAQIYTPSVADTSVAETEESFATTRATRKTEGVDMQDLSRKFAKVRASPSTPIAPAPYIGGRKVDDEDLDDDDSDGSYGYM